MIKKRDKSGQVTIFIIIGVMIVALAILGYMLYPKIKSTISSGAQSPSAFIQSCMEDRIKEDIDILSLRGGSLAPEHYFEYNYKKIEYLCYTSQYYLTCVVQQPMLKNHIEEEIKADVKDDVKHCFDDLKASYESKGYNVNMKEGNINFELLPKRVVGTFNYSLTLTKENSQKYDSFEVVLNNNLYELVSIANSIIAWEAKYGDAETTTYMNYYHDLKVEKKKQSDGTTIYILTDMNNKNKFQFASRSVAWPPGY